MKKLLAALLRKYSKVMGILALLVVLCVFMSLVAPDKFLQSNNIENLLRRTAMYGILGIGVALVIITAGIDLSIGSMVCLSGCLLALLLVVKYEPFDVQEVVQVRAAEAELMVEGKTSFASGDRIRYYGGRRARPAIVAVRRTEPATITDPDGRTRSVTRVCVDQPLSADDVYGKVARAYDVVGFERGSLDSRPPQLPTVTIVGRHPQLAARDQLMLVHPTAGLKQLRVAESRVGQDTTTVVLAADLGRDFSRQWLAVPLQRRQRMPVVMAVCAVLVVAAALGLVHGLLVTGLGLQSFVVTLCGLLIYRGVARWLVNDQVQGFGAEYERSLGVLASGKLVLWSGGSHGADFGIPYPFFIFIAIAILAAVFLNQTIWGRYLLALGRNEEAARYSGIHTGRITVLAYVICTMLAAMGGMLFALDSNSVSPSSFGNFFELYAIAAAVLGGCSLQGGQGSILGVVVGTAVMQTLYNLIVLLQISDKLEFAIIGLVILAGVVADVVVKRIVAARRAAAEETEPGVES